MTLQHSASLGIVLAVLGCAHQPPMDLELASMPIDTSTPPAIYEAIIDSYQFEQARAFIVDDHTTECMDLALPQFEKLVDTLSAPAREAFADCARKSQPPFRLPFGHIQTGIKIVPQSQRRLRPSLKSPLLFLSRPGFSADSSVVMIDVGMYCGGGLCGSSDVYWLRRSAQHWVVYAKWNLSVS